MVEVGIIIPLVELKRDKLMFGCGMILRSPPIIKDQACNTYIHGCLQYHGTKEYDLTIDGHNEG